MFMKMKKPEAFFVVTKYEENISWIKKYTDDYLICNKGKPIRDYPLMVNVKNIGKNIRDIPEFIYNIYDGMPELTAFLQGDPFFHCKKNVFNKLIYNTQFTALESYNNLPDSYGHKQDVDGGYTEINTSWYLSAYKESYGQGCIYHNFDEFMHKYFSNYKHLDYIRFAPGAQYIVEKRQALYYPRKFWKNLMLEMYGNVSAEAQLIERALWLIFQCNLDLRNEWI
jgi:hypothetical protein